jgi:putative oxidoreductase
MGIPAVFAILAIAAEFAGPIGLALGLLTRVAAFGIGIEMIVAAFLNHVKNGFFMNWAGNQHGEGFEYHILVVGVCIALMIAGGGRWSVDRAIASGKA